MDERAAQPEGHYEPSSHPQDAPPLPPSPLAEVEPESPPDMALPRSTVLTASLAGLIGGACQGIIIRFSYGMAYLSAADVAFHPAVVGALSGALLALGAVAADHYAPGRPRYFRWAIGMGLGGMVPVSHLVASGYVSGLGWFALPSALLREGFSGLVVGVILGATLGGASRSPRGLVWKLTSIALAPIGALSCVRTIPLILVWIWWLLSPPRAGGMVQFSVPVGITPTTFVAGWPFAVLFGLALAERLNVARRRAVARGPANGGAAS